MMASSSVPPILLIEDRQEMLALLTRTLSREGHDVIFATDAADGMTAALTRDPLLIVLDVGLPDRTGFEVVRDLRRRGFARPVLMLTAHDSVADKVAGLEAGADDYLAKPFDPDELTARVRALLRRAQRGGADTRLDVGQLTMDLVARTVFWGHTEVSLTQREFELLEYLMRHPGIVLRRDTISRAVWDRGADDTPNIVRVYVSYLRKKLEEAGVPEILETVEDGYVLHDRPGAGSKKRKTREP